MSQIKIDQTETEIKITSDYHPDLPEAARSLGGKWTDGKWTFDIRDRDRVAELYCSIYGYFDETPELVTLRVQVVREWGEYESGLFLAGRMVARAYGRDSGAKLGEGVVVIKGPKPKSGGSRKNWKTIAPEGCVFELRDVPLAAAIALEKEALSYFEISTLDTGRDNRADLLAERERLLARLAEIDAQLEA